MSPAPSDARHPLLKASEIQAALVKRSHSYNPDANTLQAPISDMVGMTDLGVSFVTLPPGAESTAPHFHLIDHEWIYVISGSGHLRLINAALPIHTSDAGRPLKDAAAAKSEDSPVASKSGEVILSALSLESSGTEARIQKQDLYDEEFHPVAAGDFAGFNGGIRAGKYTHSLVAGDKGMTYLCGGTRNTVDICSYPIVGKTMVFEDAEGLITPVARSGSPTPLRPRQ